MRTQISALAAGELRAAAGGTRSLSKGRLSGAARRGSFLLIVVGTIALLVVVAVLYVTIGQADRQTSAASIRLDNVKTASELFDGTKRSNPPTDLAAHIASIISDDVTATYKVGPANEPTLQSEYREAWDSPFTSFEYRVGVTDPADRRFFNPVGRLGDDPWLAPVLPTWLNYDAQAHADEDRPFQEKIDWLTISNVSPDGTFVNLFNLRGNFEVSRADLRRDLSLIGANNAPTNRTDFGRAAAVDRPADWSTRQRGLFAPTTGAHLGTFDDEQFWAYQYADADGDGFFDSRWTDMTDERLGAAGTALRSIFPRDDTYRWFAGVRIIDLSAMVNVNTATDFRVAPDRNWPAGLTPGDVDLRRLLTMNDIYFSYTDGYNAISLPPGDLTDNRSPIRNPENYLGYDALMATDVGSQAYNVLRMVMPPVRIDPNGGRWTDLGVSPSRLVTNEDSVFASNLRTLENAPAEDRLEDRYELYSAATNARFEPRGAFGIADQAELLTYFGANDPEQTSRLETVLGHRYDDANASNARQSLRYSPLRGNRSLALERGAKTDNGQQPRNTANGPADAEALLQAHGDVRKHLTTLSRSRPIRSGPVRTQAEASQAAVSGAYTLERSTSTQVGEDALKISLASATPEDVFRGFADGLLGDSALVRRSAQGVPSGAPLLWTAPASNGNPGPFGTYVYGYGLAPTGAELFLPAERPLYMSAMAAVNFADMVDSDTLPTVRTLLVDEAFARTLNQDYRVPADVSRDDGRNTTCAVGLADRGGTTPEEAARRSYHWVDGLDLDLNDGREDGGRLANTQPQGSGLPQRSDPPRVPALNVFGLEPQPFLTQVAAFAAYVDASSGLTTRPGDPDEALTNVTLQGVTTGGPISEKELNSDLLFRVVAFKLSNPFDEAITLSTDFNTISSFDVSAANYPEIDREQRYYYITFGGRTYKLAQVLEQDLGGVFARTITGLSIPANSSIVCYAVSETRDEIATRLNQLDPNIGVAIFRDRVASWIKRQMGTAAGTGINVHEIVRLGDDGKPQFEFNSLIESSGANADRAELWRVLRTSTLQNAACDPVTTVDQGSADDTPDSTTGASNAEGTNIRMTRWPGATWDGRPVPPPENGLIFGRNFRGNDQLVDRMRAPTGFNFGSLVHLPAGQQQVNSARSGPDNPNEDPDDDNDPNTPENYNTQLTITLAASFIRPSDPFDSNANRGAIPGYCLEPKFFAGDWNTALDVPGVPDVTALTLSDFEDPDYYSPDEWLESQNSRSAIVNDLAQQMHLYTGATEVPANRDGRPLRSLQHDLGLSTLPLEDNGRSLARLGDLLLASGIAPYHAPLFYDSGGSLVALTGSTRAEQDLAWLTPSEAMAIMFGYGDDSALPPVSLDHIFRPVTVGGSLVRMHDRGQLIFDEFREATGTPQPAFIPFYDNNTDSIFNANQSDGDVRVGLGIPLALAVLENFTALEASTGGLTRGTPGLINAGTAPVNVLRTVPMLSPTVELDASNLPIWWWTGGPIGEDTDVATTIAAYRDKVPMLLRPTPSGTVTTISFDNGAGIAPDEPLRVDGRQVMTGVNGLREEVGLRSVGELLLARQRFDGSGYPAAERTNPSNIDFNGYLSAGTRRLGVTSLVYRPSELGNLEASPDQPMRDPRLAIFNGASASLTTRSDVFAAWFVLHGYQRSDCEPLTNEQPLVPTIARRFLLIVDRSNVVRKGDTPRILLFKELPM
ncbi:MAG: hypothetical protein SFZ23_02340 [Planctomycetota bacterium]|nr:hypothetical protein [Planctomycetota bacterium]